MSLDTAAFHGLRNIYNMLPRTIAATGTTWLLCRTVARLELDAKTTAIFTAAASVIWYGSRPICQRFSQRTDRDLAMHVGLSYVAKEMLNLDLPLYKQFGKAYGVAIAMITAIQFCFSVATGELRRIS